MVFFYRPRTLPIPGFDLENVFLLREPAQANQIAQLAVGKKVVIIGTSFIGESFSSVTAKCLTFRFVCVGMEVAGYLSDKAASVSSIDITAVPFERVLGTEVGQMLQSVSSSSSSLLSVTLVTLDSLFR